MAMSTHDIERPTDQFAHAHGCAGFSRRAGINCCNGHDFEDDTVIRRHHQPARSPKPPAAKTDAIGQFLRPSAEAENEPCQNLRLVEDCSINIPMKPQEPIQIPTGSGFAKLDVQHPGPRQSRSDLLKSPARGDPGSDDWTMRLSQTLQPLSRITNDATALDRARSGVTALFGITIVLMAGFGFFAMQRFLVDSGRRETAIHMALGAGPRRVRRQMFVRAVKLGLPGLIIGSLLGLIVTAWLTDDLISDQISPLAIAVLTGTGLLALMITASLQPALRAARINPGPLLRED